MLRLHGRRRTIEYVKGWTKTVVGGCGGVMWSRRLHHRPRGWWGRGRSRSRTSGKLFVLILIIVVVDSNAGDFGHNARSPRWDRLSVIDAIQPYRHGTLVAVRSGHQWTFESKVIPSGQRERTLYFSQRGWVPRLPWFRSEEYVVVGLGIPIFGNEIANAKKESDHHRKRERG